MQDFPIGQVVALLLFIVLPLMSWLLERLRRRFERPPERRAPPPQPVPRTFSKPAPVNVPEPAAQRKPMPEIVEIRRHRAVRPRRKNLLSNRRDLRRAIILMTALGPCRAAQAAEHEQRQFPV
jgi:hypothetical protein